MDCEFLPQGAEAASAGVHYRIWAPQCQRLGLEIFDAEGRVLRAMPMVRGVCGQFHAFDEGGAVGDRYKYRLDVNQLFPDPASRFQPEGVHGPSMVLDPLRYSWGDAKWQRPAFRDLVIYELHLGTFTEQGTYLAAIEKLEHVAALGVTAIEIMPVHDFVGDRNWGYDGVYWYAPSRAYGTPDELRALVDAAHRLGLAVILDVVYNHLGPDGNYLGIYIGEYLDEHAKTPWGGAIRYGDPHFKPLRELVLANPPYWMREFHIDGFRLDATHAIVDESPQHLLAEMAASIRQRGGYVIAEDSRNEARLLEEDGFNFHGVWADDFHHSARVANTRESEGYLSDFEGSVDELVDTIRHGWHFRGQITNSRGRARGTESGHLPPEKFVHCISNHDQAGNHPLGLRINHLISPEAYRACSALLCLAPCTPMLFMGQEWGATTPFCYFTDHNEELGHLVTLGRREEFKDFAAFSDPERRELIPDPQGLDTFQNSKLKWDEREASSPGTLALYQDCLRLRSEEPALRPNAHETWVIEALPSEIAAMRLAGDGGDWLIVFDLVGGHRENLGDSRISTLAEGSQWEPVLSSNEERFGGAGSGYDSGTMEVDFRAPELVILRERAKAS